MMLSLWWPNLRLLQRHGHGSLLASCHQPIPTAARRMHSVSPSLTRRILSPSHLQKSFVRRVAVGAQKREGDISDAFVSLSGQKFKQLPERYAQLKRRLIVGNEDAIRASWERLLSSLKEEIPLIAESGPGIVPQVDFKDIDDPPESFVSEHRKRGVAVIRGVIPEDEVLRYKDDLKDYIRRNPQTKGS
jgi:hypothetical protein